MWTVGGTEIDGGTGVGQLRACVGAAGRATPGAGGGAGEVGGIRGGGPGLPLPWQGCEGPPHPPHPGVRTVAGAGTPRANSHPLVGWARGFEGFGKHSEGGLKDGASSAVSIVEETPGQGY